MYVPHVMEQLIKLVDIRADDPESAPGPNADCAKADGRSGETTPGIKNANPMKRKLWKMSRGRNASARGRRRSSGQMYRAATIPHAIKLNAMLTKKASCVCINSSY